MVAPTKLPPQQQPVAPQPQWGDDDYDFGAPEIWMPPLEGDGDGNGQPFNGCTQSFEGAMEDAMDGGLSQPTNGASV